MSAENASPAFVGFEDSAAIPLEEVLALQGLVMGHVRRMAMQKGRKIHVGTEARTHTYSMMDNSGDDIFSGERDQYLGVRVRRLGFRAWSMGISVLENDMTAARYASSLRTRYQFRWDHTEALGRKLEDLRIGAPYSKNNQQPDTHFMSTRDTHAVRLVTPIAANDMDIIATRTLEVAAGSTSRMDRFLDKYVPAIDTPSPDA